MAISIIKKKKLSDDEIIIFSSGYEPLNKLPYLKKSFESLNKGLLEKIICWNTPKEQDKYVNSFLSKDEKFVAYIDLMHMHQRILITNKNCQNFSFIEEGTASYILPNTIEDISYIHKKKSDRYNSVMEIILDMKLFLRGYNSKLIAMAYTPQSYNELAECFYCFSSLAYPRIEDKKKVIINLNEIEFEDFFLNTPILKNDVIWIEESFTYAYKIPEIEYEQAILETIKKMDKVLKGKTIYLKKRPSQETKKSLVYKVLSEKGFEINILDNKIILEVLLLKSDNCSLIGNVSSLLFYGSLFGHKSYSMFSSISKKPKTVFDDLNFYWDSVSKF
jgi:hypothetical protein